MDFYISMYVMYYGFAVIILCGDTEVLLYRTCVCVCRALVKSLEMEDLVRWINLRNDTYYHYY